MLIDAFFFWGGFIIKILQFFCFLFQNDANSSRGSVQSTPYQGAAARPDPDAARSEHPCRGVCAGGQH